jgi:putative transposase
VHTQVRELARKRVGRQATPSAAIIDRQSVKMQQGGPRGFDGGKQVWGRKRYLVVETPGLLLEVVVHPASLHDRLGAKLVLNALGPGAGFPHLQLIWADQGDAGALRRCTQAHTGSTWLGVYPWWRQLKRYLPELLDVRGYQPGFNVLPRRWVVERTLSWLGRSRRLSRDYERLPISSEALIYLTCIRLLLVRLVSHASGSLLIRFRHLMTELVRHKRRGFSSSGQAELHGFSPCFSALIVAHSFERQVHCGTLVGRLDTATVALSPAWVRGGTAVASNCSGRAGARSATSPSPPVARTRLGLEPMRSVRCPSHLSELRT